MFIFCFSLLKQEMFSEHFQTQGAKRELIATCYATFVGVCWTSMPCKQRLEKYKHRMYVEGDPANTYLYHLNH